MPKSGSPSCKVIYSLVVLNQTQSNIQTPAAASATTIPVPPFTLHALPVVLALLFPFVVLLLFAEPEVAVLAFWMTLVERKDQLWCGAQEAREKKEKKREHNVHKTLQHK
jgi:hypothetical protein